LRAFAEDFVAQDLEGWVTVEVPPLASEMDYPALLAPGLHPKTWTELSALCVDGFPLSQSRPRILQGLRSLVEKLVAEGLELDLWADGSFLTLKDEPGDVDFVLRLDLQVASRLTGSQIALLQWLGTRDLAVRAQIKQDYGCDPYVFVDVPTSHPFSGGVDLRQYWLTQFGADRSNNPKGIATLSIPNGVQ
jgi:hypothetical protein